MQENPTNHSNSQAKLKDLVVLTLLESIEEAREYEALLKVNDIPVVIKEHNDSSKDERNVAIMVPEDFLDEAHVVIESQDAYDDFYDFALEDEELDDFDPDFDEDNY